MSPNLKMTFSALVVLLIIGSCSLRNTINVTDRNFGEEIETRQNLVFKFDSDLVPDSLINIWDSTAYILFKPEVKGMFKWNSQRELVFSPTSEFKPATAYTAELTTDLLKKLASNKQLPAENTFKFHTPFLKVENLLTWWSIATDEPGMVKLQGNLLFNYDVDPMVIAKQLQLKINGVPTEFKLSDQGIGKELKFQTTSISAQSIASSKLEYTISTGATCVQCGQGITAAITGTQDVKAPDKLEVTQVEGVLETAGGSILVYCNQEVITENAAALIKITPAVPFTVSANGNGFIISGNFVSGASYELEVKKELSGAIGGAMVADYKALVAFGEMEPTINFTSNKGLYLSDKSSKKVGINIVNIPKVHLRVFKIYENNILAFMRYHRYEDYWDDEGSSRFSYNDYNIDQLGDEIMNQEYDTKNLEKRNGVSLLNLDFEKQQQFKGIYLVTISSTEDRWRKATKLISISDIGLMAKYSGDEVIVFANSIKSAAPLRGAKITLISTNNQVIGTANTNSDGVASIQSLQSKHPDFRVGMITARDADDFNYMTLSDTRVEDSRFDVGGKTNNPSGYEAFIYGDREIYRPGEKVYFNTIIRTTAMNNLADVPVKIKIVMPNGGEYTNIRKTLNSQGAAEGSVQLGSGVVTGTWSMELYTSNNIFLTTRSFSVEEFIPDRISVTVKQNDMAYEPGDSVKNEVRAMNLFGTPAVGRNYEMDFSLRRKTVYSKTFSDYNFHISGADNIVYNNIFREGKTNEAGDAIDYFPVSNDYANTGMLDGRIYTTVFDETGRPVNRVMNFDVSTQKNYFGLKLSDYYNSTKQPLVIGMAATDMKGNAVGAATANLQVIRVTWETVMERTYGTRYRYVSQKNEKVVIDKMVTIAKNGSTFTFTPNESGHYYIRLKEAKAYAYVQSEFYAYGWGSTQSNAFEVNNEGTIDMEFDKESYEAGDKAKVLFKTPFAGKMLVTIERDKVFEYFYVTTDKRSASVDIPVKEAYLPNVYITATLFRALDDATIPVTIAHGFKSLPVTKKSTLLPVEIIAVEKSRSKTKQEIKVKTRPNSGIEVTIAVVDEGIMQLKNSKSPDPHGYFYQKRALEVNAYDIYPYVLPDFTSRSSSVGGDGYDLQKRVNPMSNKRVKLVATWSGILKTDGNGMASCQIDIPQFSGDLRIMAVAYKDASFGHAEKHMKVADPIIISPSIPRFLSPGDTLTLPVTITNTLAKSQQAAISVVTTGPLKVTSTATVNNTIEGGKESRPVFKIAVAKQIGEGTISIKVNTGSETFSDFTDITVRPAASLQKVSGSGEITAGTTASVQPASNFIPSSREGKLVLSTSPVVQFSDQLSYLLDYPHGCLEQTVSTAFPQIYFASLSKAIKNKPGKVVQISTNVQAAISKLQSMQQYNGALTYWQGGDYESWWGTAYAYHFLQEAKKAGYDVNDAFLNKIAVYLATKVKQHPTETYYYYDEKGALQKKEIASKDIFYSMYLLSLYHKSDLATMNFYRSKISTLALDSRYLLAASYLASGDRKAYTELLPKLFDGEKSIKNTGGNFYSYVRDEALALNALLETDPTNNQIGMMVRNLSTQLKTQPYLSTQERAFAFLALGKFMKQATVSKVTATVTADGKMLGEFKGSDLTINKGFESATISINTSGSGKLYYFWEMEGLTADGSFKQEDSQLMIRKTYYNRFGQPLPSLNGLKQNELVVVKLTLTNMTRNNVDNVVITDILPAGIEIENPRVSSVPELQWIKDNTIPNHMDIRDDRINYFTGIGSIPQSFYYMARAVSTGKFVMGPVSADAMYDGSFHSYHGAGTVTITE